MAIQFHRPTPLQQPLPLLQRPQKPILNLKQRLPQRHWNPMTKIQQRLKTLETQQRWLRLIQALQKPQHQRQWNRQLLAPLSRLQRQQRCVLNQSSFVAPFPKLYLPLCLLQKAAQKGFSKLPLYDTLMKYFFSLAISFSIRITIA